MPNTPVGNIVLNDVVVTGALSPASPTAGQQFNVTGSQIKEQLPATVVQDAAATGLTSLTGTLDDHHRRHRRNAPVDLDRGDALRHPDPESRPARRG